MIIIFFLPFFCVTEFQINPLFNDPASNQSNDNSSLEITPNHSQFMNKCKKDSSKKFHQNSPKLSFCQKTNTTTTMTTTAMSTSHHHSIKNAESKKIDKNAKHENSKKRQNKSKRLSRKTPSSNSSSPNSDEIRQESFLLIEKEHHSGTSQRSHCSMCGCTLSKSGSQMSNFSGEFETKQNKKLPFETLAMAIKYHFNCANTSYSLLLCQFATQTSGHDL